MAIFVNGLGDLMFEPSAGTGPTRCPLPPRIHPVDITAQRRDTCRGGGGGNAATRRAIVRRDANCRTKARTQGRLR